VLAIMAVAIAGCSREQSAPVKGDSNMVLAVNWQRLVTDAGRTCDRCGSTEDEFHRAIVTLRESLRPLGIDVESTETALTPEEFAGDTIASNRILIRDRTVEEWLGGEVGQSPCESCCTAVGAGVECRAVLVDGTTYEAVPAELIVRAGLVAASVLLQESQSSPCCPGSDGAKEADKPSCSCGPPDECAGG